ncbi:hypothetical protein BBAD15_g5512 [Beauveria bassiana D1-5]|uniref:Uncharacterized protein n=1 Tax=Beauveria bassiana D1-5 TaxID=1245745 RepID=A0A0A2VMR7_BEABA|nr:hypothetical protein BBAD15_g5512 [Beauveria bassiana D1-5]
MEYIYSYNSSTARHCDDYRYSTRIRIETPKLSFPIVEITSPSSFNRLPYSVYSPREADYYNRHHRYCYSAGPSYPAHSANWEHNRAASPRPNSQRTRHQSGKCPDELLSRHRHQAGNTDSWNRMVQREAALDKSNKDLVYEVGNLKKDLATAEAEVHRLGSVVIPQLECQITNLSAENQELRRQLQSATGSCGRHHVEIEALRIRICHQDKEIKDLECDKSNLERRVEELLRQIGSHQGSGCGGGCNRRIEDLTRDVVHWKDRFLDMQQRRNNLSEQLDEQSEKIRTYEEILRQNGFIIR